MTLIEATMGLMIVAVCTTIAVPIISGAMTAYELSAAVHDVSGAIQNARYLAIQQGYHYNISFTQGTHTYQVGSKLPPATTYSNVGGLIPWTQTANISISPTTTLEFSPGGIVSATTGTFVFTLSNGSQLETITVSGVGNVSVSP